MVTDLGDRQRVDSGPGTHSYETRGYITDLRVSPAGDRVAFLDHPVRDALLGTVVLFDPKSGESRTLAGAPRGRDYLGLAWRPDGREIWLGEYGQVRAVTLEGRERTVAQLPESVRLHDIAPDGRVLLSQESRRVQMALRSMDDPRIRDLSWLTWSLPMAFSPDGRLLLFTEFPQRPGGGAIAALRPVDGSPLVRLGDGFATSFSPDGEWVFAVSIGVPSQIVLLPAGAGEARLMPRGAIETHSFGLFLPDGQEVVFVGRESGRGNRLYRQRISGGEPTAISPEGLGLSLLLLSPDGSQIVATWKDRPWLFSLAGGEPRALAGASPGELAAGWTADGQRVYLRGMAAETPLRRVNVRDGSTDTVCIVHVPDAAGVQWIGPLVIAPDERTFAYGYHRVLSTLYTVDGLR
jgi:dipeptidyl aminopeptidase/acylaminoacyl peptidase